MGLHCSTRTSTAYADWLNNAEQVAIRCLLATTTTDRQRHLKGVE